LLPQWNFPINPFFQFESNAPANPSELQFAERRTPSVAMGAQRTPSSQPASVIGNPQSRYTTMAVTAYKSDATVARVWNLQGTNGQEPDAFPLATAAGDFLHDGTTYIAVNYRTDVPGVFSFSGPVPGMVAVLRTGTSIPPGDNDWPSYYQNTHNTATLRRSV